VGIVVLGLGRIGVPHAVSADTNKAGIASRLDRRLVASNVDPLTRGTRVSCVGARGGVHSAIDSGSVPCAPASSPSGHRPGCPP
jgi:hypothetical protein